VQFTQDIIDTLGKRITELVLPIPRDSKTRKKIAEETKYVILKRIELRNRARQIAIEVEGLSSLRDEDEEVLQEL